MIKSIKPLADKQMEGKKIGRHINSVLNKSGFKRLVIGVSGGIDSATSLYLACRTISPQNIFIAHLYYFESQEKIVKKICSELKIPVQNQYLISIKKPVDELKKLLKLTSAYKLQTITQVRLGNVMARIRMIILFDLAKKHKALVLGTENKSEHLLGYFTRFGDAASDIEPIAHLYKTQVYQLAKYLKVPGEIVRAKPSAGLWSHQTDEGEFGFSYQEADQVLYLYHDRGLDSKKIKKLGFKNAEKIINFTLKNSFKHQVPYSLF